MKWVKIDYDNNTGFPTTNGKYIVRMHTGSISPKIVVVESFFNLSVHSRHTFSVAGDWNYVTEWLDESDIAYNREQMIKAIEYGSWISLNQKRGLTEDDKTDYLDKLNR